MTPAAAQCAVHPQTVATRTCARCGNFMCNECSLGGSELNCPKCRALTGDAFPFTRTNHDFSRLWDLAFEAWKREWAMLCVGFIILMAAAMAGGLVGNVFSSVIQGIVGKSNTGAFIGALVIGQIFVQFLQQAAVGAMQMGWLRMMFDALRGGKADVGRMFTQLNKIPSFLGQWLIVFVMFGLPTLLYFGIVAIVAIKVTGADLPGFDFQHKATTYEWQEFFGKVGPILALAVVVAIVPLYWLYFTILLIPMEIVYGNAKAWESIQRAFTIAKGFRLSIFGYSFVGGLVAIVGILACCVGVIPAAALAQMLIASLYLSLRNGSGLPPPPEG
jgi:hypothetical protein